ncbi:sulfurase [Actinoplanes sp. SE50]|uniref:MOSC domain-containing protein n=1 Tax=unclassified Actinoplanes TaxID=2626549 RepID=UPI00023ECC20|nr:MULTISPECIES: MOSC N-terminal beta barrel domain-containing protein [unclassified Actinoplanes]AEV82076.1 Molybdenum cofactor sulfurase [Actinoplanes sp. SE50/110]ATO80475.1 sulfurase [Actinoplanes sp. SE50]SLL97882.1 sulfurase [Actinoplanes sp. SE50/110]
MRIRDLHTYPVKGCHRLDHAEAEVQPWGLAGDRRWMMVDPDGVGLTQRDEPRLTQLAVHPRPGGLRLSAPGLPDLEIDEPAAGAKISVRVFRNKPEVPARVAESQWSSAFLGRDARLTWQADPTGRTIADRALPSDRVSFADSYPLLLASTASLDAVNDWLAEAGEDPVPMHRFRPNLVVTGAPAWAEDGWLGGRLRIGEVTFRVAKHCARCLVVTIDQETGETGRQPLHVLGRHRRIDGGLMFGVKLIPDLAAGRSGVVRPGDAVTPLE